MSNKAKKKQTHFNSEHYIHAKRPKKVPVDELKLVFKATPNTPQNKLPKTFLGVPCEKVTYRIPPKTEQKALREEFELEVRKKFIKHIAKTQRKELLAEGISEEEIKLMVKDGNTPNGYNTHHILPIHGGGDNDFSNLVLIKRVPYHDMMHYNLMSPQTKGMKEGDVREVVIPKPNGGKLFVPGERFRILEHHAENGRKTYGKGERITFNHERRASRNRLVVKKALTNALKNKGR